MSIDTSQDVRNNFVEFARYASGKGIDVKFPDR